MDKQTTAACVVTQRFRDTVFVDDNGGDDTDVAIVDLHAFYLKHDFSARVR